MSDLRKIDAYFDDKAPIEKYSGDKKAAESGWLKFAKLGFPCLAAALLGVMIVLPSIRKSVDLRDNVTVPRKNEMEKLHVEETVFSATDSKNRINRLQAVSIDEVEVGSQKVKMIRPSGTIPTDSGMVDISSDEGFFTQEINLLDLVKNVKAVVDNNTVITTEAASYDFNTDMGYGNVQINAEGDWGTLTADAFNYDKKSEILSLYGHSHLVGHKGELTAEKENRYYLNEDKIISEKNVVLRQKDKSIRADKVISFLTKSSPKEVTKAEAYGNVLVKTATSTAKGVEGYYEPERNLIRLYGKPQKEKQNGIVTLTQGDKTLFANQIFVHLLPSNKNEIDYVEALGQVKVRTPTETASGAEGVYNLRRHKVLLYGSPRQSRNKKGKVKITQGENVLTADNVVMYLLKNNKTIDYVEALGKVKVVTPKGTAEGDRGVYKPQENLVELWDNVQIEQNGNFVRGGHAQTDLNTSVSKIMGAKKGERISGTFYKRKKVSK